MVDIEISPLELDQILADVLSEAAVLTRNDGKFTVARVEEMVRDIKLALREYLTFVSEAEAIVRSSHKEPWFRQRFPEWERQGHARWDEKHKSKRQYRLLIVPLAHDDDDVRSAARRAARASFNAVLSA